MQKRGQVHSTRTNLVDVNTVLHALYSRARFDLRLDYTQPAVPPLSEDDTNWMHSLDRPDA